MTSGVYKYEQFYLNNCNNEREFNDNINSMKLTEIKEIVIFPYIIREENHISQRKRIFKNYMMKLSLKIHGKMLDQVIMNLRRSRH